MKIKNIKIKNWRSIKKMKITAQDLMIIIGQNNHGKSNLLSAILFFFGEIKHQDLDFHSGENKLFVDIEFSELDELDKKIFGEYITTEGTIKVRKIAYLGGSFEYKGWKQIFSDDFLKEENFPTFPYFHTELKDLPYYQYLRYRRGISEQEIKDAKQKYIQANSANLSFTYSLEKTDFMGVKSITKGIFGKVYFLPTVKNAIDEFTSENTSIFAKLLSEIVESMSQYNNDWQSTKEKLIDLFSKFNKYIDGVENTNRPKELSDLENKLSQELLSWNASLDIEFNIPDISLVLKSNSAVWVNDGARTDISRKGHGLQRALIIALMQFLAKQQLQSECNSKTTTGVSKSRYFIFEEPELYLHPQAQRVLFDSFVDLSNTGSQVILCTHSSNLINIDKYKSIYIVRKENDQTGSTITQCEDDLFDGSERENWNLSYWINPDRGELFFAEKVILVEGPTEKTIIPALAKQLNVFRHDYTIIDCGSKDSIPLYLKLLNKFGIKYIAVYDQDHQHNKSQEAKDTATRSTDKILNLIENKFGQSIAFINDIEEELGYPSGNSGKPFKALQYIKSDTFNLLNQLKEKIIKIYQ